MNEFVPQSDSLLLYATANDVNVLGPGSRYVVWVQGCNRHCIGCATPDAQSFTGGYIRSVSELADEIKSSDLDGLTFSGGEPMLQAEALENLYRIVCEEKDVGLIVYTGYTYEDLVQFGTAAQKKLLKQTDVLIDGSYLMELDDNEAHRGSSNQRIIFLSHRYEREKIEYYDAIKNRRIQHRRMSDNQSMEIGIPEALPKELIEWLRGNSSQK